MNRDSFFPKTVNGKLSLTLIILVTILCWSITIIFKSDDVIFRTNTGLFYTPLLKALSPHTLLIINYLLVLGAGLLLLWLNQVFSIIRTKTFLPFLFYTLFITADTSAFFSLSGNLCTVISLSLVYHLFKAYQKEKSVEEAFNIGLLLSVGSLFSTQMLLFIPMIWIGLSFMQAFSGKSFFASIVGILTPYWPAFCWFLYKKDIAGFTEPFGHLFNFDLYTVFKFEVTDWISMGFSLLITIFAVTNFRLHSFKDKIKTRIYFYFILTLIIYVALLMLTGLLPISEYVGVYYFSVSLFAAHFFATVNTRLSTIFFYLLLITFIGLLFFDM